MKWRIAEVAPPGLATSKSNPGPYEINPLWESQESVSFNPDIAIPPSSLKVGHVYRVRVRMKDATDRWSHWSPPVQFTLAQEKK